MTETCSRLCVKNIPGYVDEARLREHFGGKGDITDAKVIRASDGHSRQFAFVGFKTADEAQLALEYFNNSYMDSSRLSIQFAYQRGSEAAPQAWSKYTPGTSAHSRAVAAVSLATNADSEMAKKSKAEASKRKREGPEEEDPALREFLQAMQPRSKAAIWSNDVTAASAQSGQSKVNRRNARPEAMGMNDSDNSDDEYADLPAGISAPTGRGAAETADGSTLDGSDAEEVEDAAVRDEGVSDMDYLRSRVRGSGNSSAIEGDAEGDDREDDDDSSGDGDDDEADASDGPGGGPAAADGGSGAEEHSPAAAGAEATRARDADAANEERRSEDAV